MVKKKTKNTRSDVELAPVEVVAIGDLKPHPRNYRDHPPDQLTHLAESLKQNGVYKNIVIARDGTILAGHGVTEAAKIAGIDELPARRLDLDPFEPRALKILAADNELPKFAENDDRKLTEMLQEVMRSDPLGLLGTGYDEKNLAALLMVTRPASEIHDMDAAAEWVGMPEYDEGARSFKIIVTFETEEARKEFTKAVQLEGVIYKGAVWSARWPPAPREDAFSIRFEGKK